MKRHHKLLKLIYAGFTSQELHKIYNVYHSFDLNFLQLKPILRQILNCHERTLDNKLSKFQNLKIKMLIEELENKEITPIYFDSEVYPRLLLEIYDYPFVLFAKGNINLLNYTNALAIVGSRDATHYTADALDQIVPELIKIIYTSSVAWQKVQIIMRIWHATFMEGIRLASLHTVMISSIRQRLL